MQSVPIPTNYASNFDPLVNERKRINFITAERSQGSRPQNKCKGLVWVRTEVEEYVRLSVLSLCRMVIGNQSDYFHPVADMF